MNKYALTPHPGHHAIHALACNIDAALDAVLLERDPHDIHDLYRALIELDKRWSAVVTLAGEKMNALTAERV